MGTETANASRTSADDTERELIRLWRLLESPEQYVIRRVEELTFTHPSRYRWDIKSEILIPVLDQAHEDDPESSEPRLVSLGIYTKERMPDLVARTADGEILHLLGSAARSNALAYANVTGRFPPDTPRSALIDAQHEIAGLIIADDRVAVERTAALLDQLKNVNGGPSEDGDLAQFTRRRVELDARKGEMEGKGWLDIWHEELTELARTTHVLAWVDARIGQTVVITHSYSEAFVPLDVPFGRSVLNALGMLPTGTALFRPHVDHAASYHLVVNAADGMSVEDLHWASASEADGANRKLESVVARGSVVTLSAARSDVRMQPVEFAQPLRPGPIGRAVRKVGKRLTWLLVGWFAQEPASTAPPSDQPRDAHVRFGLQLHPRGLPRLSAVAFGTLAATFVLLAMQLDQVRAQPQSAEAAAAVLVAAAGVPTLILSARVTRATRRLAEGIRLVLVVGSGIAFLAGGFVAFAAPTWSVIAVASAGTGFSVGMGLVFGWDGWALRVPRRFPTTAADVEDWRRQKLSRAYARLAANLAAGVVAAALVIAGYNGWLCGLPD